MGILQPYSRILARTDRDGGLRRLVDDALQETAGILCTPIHVPLCVSRLVVSRTDTGALAVFLD